MPKGQQRSNKEVKKPKKDKSTVASPSTAPRPPPIVVPDRQKNK
jgi:hypothetical protein